MGTSLRHHFSKSHPQSTPSLTFLLLLLFFFFLLCCCCAAAAASDTDGDGDDTAGGSVRAGREAGMQNWAPGPPDLQFDGAASSPAAFRHAATRADPSNKISHVWTHNTANGERRPARIEHEQQWSFAASRSDPNVAVGCWARTRGSCTDRCGIAVMLAVMSHRTAATLP